MNNRASKGLVAITAAALAVFSCVGKQDILEVEIEPTDLEGKAYLGQPVQVRNEVNVLAGALVYQVQGSNNSYLTLGLEQDSRPLPARQESSAAFSEYGEDDFEANRSSLNKSALIPEIVLLLQTARSLDYARRDAQKQRRQFMGDLNNVNRYCVTLEQMTESYIRVPMGIIGVASEEIKIRALVPLERLFERYVVKRFGQQEGYEVWVPKTAVNLCGEDFSGIICPIDQEVLSERLWMHANIPSWDIKGPCDPYNSPSWQR